MLLPYWSQLSTTNCVWPLPEIVTRGCACGACAIIKHFIILKPKCMTNKRFPPAIFFFLYSKLIVFCVFPACRPSSFPTGCCSLAGRHVSRDKRLRVQWMDGIVTMANETQFNDCHMEKCAVLHL